MTASTTLSSAFLMFALPWQGGPADLQLGSTPQLRIRRHPYREQRVRGVDRGQHAVLRVRSAGRAAEMADLDRDQRRVRPEARGGHQGSDRLSGQVVEQHPVGGARHRFGRVIVQGRQSWWRDHRERVHLRLELAERREMLGAAGPITEPGRLHHDERAPAQRLGDLLQRRHVQ